MLPLMMILRDRKAALERRRQAASEEAERAAYIPDAPRKVDLGDGRVAYEAMSESLVRPGDVANVMFGISVPEEGTGFPGLPKTQVRHFGVEENFEPEAIRIPEGFSLVEGFVGAQNMLRVVYGVEIPAGALAEGRPQPEYPVALRGYVITLQVKNVSDRQVAFRGRVEGREIVKEEA